MHNNNRAVQTDTPQGINFAEDFLRLAIDQGKNSNSRAFQLIAQDITDYLSDNNKSYLDLVAEPELVYKMVNDLRVVGAEDDIEGSRMLQNIQLAIESATTSDEKINADNTARRNTAKEDDGYTPMQSNVDGQTYYVNKHTGKFLTRDEYYQTNSSPDSLGWSDGTDSGMFRNVSATSDEPIQAQSSEKEIGSY